MWQLITSITLVIVSINQIYLVNRLRKQKQIINAIMDMLIKKWTLEQELNNTMINKYIDESISELFKREND